MLKFQNMVDLSIIIPFYNERDNLPILHKELITILRNLNFKSEIVYIDDGSTDTWKEKIIPTIKENKSEKVTTKLISLDHNFGQTAATAAGIDHAEGKILAFFDADLQNSPKDLPKFIDKFNEGYDAVFGWRKKRSDDFFRNFFSSIANIIIRNFFKVPLHDLGCSLKVVRRSLLYNFKLYSEYHRLLPALIYWKGAKITEITVNHRPRIWGRSKYGYSRIFKLIIDLITIKFLSSYQTKPSYVFGIPGIICEILAILVLFLVAYRKFFLGTFVHRDPLFLIAIFLIIVGIQFILMGLIAELIVRTYFESQKKNIYEKPKVVSI